MSSESDLFFIAHMGNQQIILNGAEPVVRVEGSDTLGEHRGIGVLKVPQLGARPIILIVVVDVVVVVGSGLSYLLQRGDASLMLSPRVVAILQKKAKDLRHVGVWRWWGIGVIVAVLLSAGSGRHPDYGTRVEGKTWAKARQNKVPTEL